MLLTAYIRITGRFNGTSKDAFWEKILIGDTLKVSSHAGYTGKYALGVSIENMKTGDKTSLTGGRLKQYMNKLTYERIDNEPVVQN